MILSSLLIESALCVATQDDAGTELAGASVWVRDGWIAEVLPAGTDLRPYRTQADECINAARHLVVPGLINTHHHMVQSLTRAIPAGQNAELFSWLRCLYPIWAGLRPDMITVSHQVAMAELLLSGCCTSSDHLYIYPNGCRLEDSIAAAHAIGLRFVATRGAMTLGESQGGLPPDRVVEREPMCCGICSVWSRLGTTPNREPCCKLVWPRVRHLL